jgi:preprotein translocase subunit SecD
MKTAGGFMTLLAGTLASLALAAADPAVKVEIRRAQDEPGPGLVEGRLPESDQAIYLAKQVELSSDDFASAAAGEENGRPVVNVTLTEAGAKKMRVLSRGQLEKRLAVLVDGRILMAPRVLSEIGAQFQISGNFKADEAQRLAAQIVGKKN